MLRPWTRICSCGILLFTLGSVARAQDVNAFVQQAVDSERAANKADHSNWTYLEELHKPKEHLVQWVAATQQGSVERVLVKNDEKPTEQQQRDMIQKFLHDPHAQKKQIEENAHDGQQVDDFLKLLPTAFLWTRTGADASNTYLHFEPNPNFHPPTREARVFSEMSGDLTVDNQQHRVRAMSGRLARDVTFGGGLLGRLKQGSSFSLEQAPVGESLWQLTSIRVHLEGNALLFKSVSLQQDDERSRFSPEPASITLDQAAALVMTQPEQVPAK